MEIKDEMKMEEKKMAAETDNAPVSQEGEDEQIDGMFNKMLNEEERRKKAQRHFDYSSESQPPENNAKSALSYDYSDPALAEKKEKEKAKDKKKGKGKRSNVYDYAGAAKSEYDAEEWEKLKKKPAWETYSDSERENLEKLAKGYIDFLSECKTERESVDYALKMAKEAGYVDLEEYVKSGKKIVPGDKVYAVYMKKALALFNFGIEPLEDGMSILGAHIDTCRLDLKQNPIYESDGFCYLDTHYYGGIKKYQWVTLPLALHGVVAKKDGLVVDVCLGEKDDEPAFCVTDLLIHLAQEQMEKKANKVIEGENLDILCGHLPILKDQKDDEDADEKDDEKKAVKDAIKANTLRILKEKYGIEEDDFLSAELTFVPAGRAREMGFDRSMILGYGQDDRVCAYTSLVAMLEADTVRRTSCCLLVDKEEIGSVGATGMQSRFFENIVAEIINLFDTEKVARQRATASNPPVDIMLRRVLANSQMLSSDVSSAFDALYASAFDKRNVAYLGKGVVFNKFTGARGKSGSNDANAEYLAHIRQIMDRHNVRFQLSELGKVDLGGGGTIAYIMALYGMDVIDSGVAVLSMHAPWEVTSKIDVYEAKKAYLAFIAD